MTPAERARQIDKEEFAAECAAIRERANAYAAQRREAEAEKLDAFFDGVYGVCAKKPARQSRPNISRHPNPSAIEKAVRANQTKAKRYAAFGRALSLREWSEETGVTVSTIYSRLKYGWTLEEAVSREVQVHRRANSAPERDPTAPFNEASPGGQELLAVEGDRRGEARASDA